MFLCRPAVPNLENSLSLKIPSHESSKTSRQISNSEASSKPENCLNSISLMNETLADHVDKHKKIFETLGKICHVVTFWKSAQFFRKKLARKQP